MSKTTKKLGIPLYIMRFTVDSTTLPSLKLKAEWEQLDKAAVATFGKPYDKLNSREKGEIHFQLNVAKESEAVQRRAAKKKHPK